MTAYEKAVAIHPWIKPEDFRRITDEYYNVGYVFEMDELFAIVKPVNANADYRDIVSPKIRFKTYHANCYYIPVCVGSLVRLCDELKPNLRYVCFSRLVQVGRETKTKNDLRFYSTERIKRLIN